MYALEASPTAYADSELLRNFTGIGVRCVWGRNGEWGVVTNTQGQPSSKGFESPDGAARMMREGLNLRAELVHLQSLGRQ